MKTDSEAGPLVWLIVPLVTCFLLFIFQGILWLVIPTLLAIVFYYLTIPLVFRLMHRGFSRDIAAGIVMMGLLLFAALVALMIIPMVGDLNSWTRLISRYTQSGVAMCIHILEQLEHYVPVGHKFSVSFQQVKWDDLFSELIEEYSGQMLSQIFHWLPAFLLIPYLTFFLLREGDRFKRFIVQAIPNAFFERTLLLFYQIDDQVRRYLQGLFLLTAFDAVCLGIGLLWLHISHAVELGLLTAFLAWIPYVGSVLGCLIVVLVAATDYPGNSWIVYGAIILFLSVRFLDDFIFLPLTIGRNLKVHPVVSVLMIFIGGAVAGVSGLLLVMPVLGVVMVFGQVIGQLWTEERVRARHAYAVSLRKQRAQHDLEIPA